MPSPLGEVDHVVASFFANVGETMTHATYHSVAMDVLVPMFVPCVADGIAHANRDRTTNDCTYPDHDHCWS